MKFCQALNGSLNIERDRIHYCYVVKQHMPSIPWNPEEELPIECIQLVRDALLKGLNEDMDQIVPEYEKFGEHSGGTHPCKGCRHIVEIDNEVETPCIDQLTDYLHMQAFTYCNAKCVYCNLSHDAGRIPINKGRDLDRAVYGAVNLLIDKNMISPECRVIFSSGEPTLSELGIKTLMRLVERGQNILVNTNAICFSPELEKAMHAGNTDVQVSLDCGDRESFIDIKGVDKFDAVAKNIDRYVAAASDNSQFWLKYIVFSKTTSQKTLDQFVDFCSEHHIRNVVVNVNYNEGEAVSANTQGKTVSAPDKEVADISTLRAFGYLTSKLELRGFRVHKELAHLTVHEQQLAEREYSKAMQAELSSFDSSSEDNRLRSITIFNLTPYGNLIKDFTWNETNFVDNNETATMNMAAAFKKIGFEVTILTDRESLEGHNCDIFVSNREWEFFKDTTLPGRLNYLWCHDDVNESEPDPLKHPTNAKPVYDACDGVIFSSHYQQQRWLKLLNVPLEKSFLSSNGIPYDKFANFTGSLSNRPPQAYYPSSSLQGLVILLKGWPLIKSAVPEAELHLFRPKSAITGSEKESFTQLYRLANKLNGVTCDELTKRSQLWNEAQRCRVLASPSILPLVDCTNELEAMAGGSVVVSMALGALPETAWHNPLIPMVDGWFRQWVAEVVKLLVDDQHYQLLAQHNLDSVSYYDWNAVATRWQERFNSDLVKKKGA